MRDEEFEALRAWGDALVRDPRPEVAAAGKAVQILAAEVERLQVELWNTQLGVFDAGADETAASQAPFDAAYAPDLAGDLTEQASRARGLRRRLHLPTRRSSA
ncbi:MAG: hypothetical protein U0R69_01325 [Gaiellales bacterium]